MNRNVYDTTKKNVANKTTYIDEHYEGVVRVAKKHIMSTFFSVLGWVISIILSVVLFYLGR